jgi:hypothetical protein
MARAAARRVTLDSGSMWRRELIGVAVGLAALTGAGPARAADVTVGASLANPPVANQACQGTGCTLMQTTDPAPGFVLAVPADGTITSWRAIGDQQVRLRVLRDAGGGKWTAVASSPPAALAATPTDNRVSIPVRAGDRIGVDLDPGAFGTDFTVPRIGYAQVDGASYAFFARPLADGASDAPFGNTGGAELLVQATVSVPGSGGGGSGGGGPGGSGGGGGGSTGASECVVPRLRGKSVRRARRALARAGCSLGRVRRRGRARHPHVISQGAKAGTHKAAGAAVDVRVG